MYEHGKGRKIGLKVVLDTNVYISIFNWPASPLAELWWHAQKGTYELFVSPVIVDELGATLRKEFFWGNADIVYHLKLVTSVRTDIPHTYLLAFKNKEPHKEVPITAIPVGDTVSN